MAPASFRAKLRGDNKQTTHSQTSESNLSSNFAGVSVAAILEQKGDATFSVSPDDSIKQATQVLKSHSIGAVLVKDNNDTLIGILSERDIVRQLADTPGATLGHQVKKVMTADPQCCQPSDKVIDIMKRMTDGRFRHMPVVDQGQVCGLLTIGDVVKFRLLELEYEALKMKQMIVG